jgi:antitoxin HicB
LPDNAPAIMGAQFIRAIRKLGRRRGVEVRSEPSTDGADQAEALAEAADCLSEAVAARICDGEDLPAPSRLRRGMHAVPLPPVLAYKAALFTAMRREGVSKSALARRLGVNEKDVRRLLDPGYRGSKLERLHAALAALGVVAQITLVDTARGGRLLRPASRGPGAEPRSRPRPEDSPRAVSGSGDSEQTPPRSPGSPGAAPAETAEKPARDDRLS